MPVELAKGLELDGVVLVEPARIVTEERQGLRALYVALTRATRRLAIVHAEPLPEALVGPSEASASAPDSPPPSVVRVVNPRMFGYPNVRSYGSRLPLPLRERPGAPHRRARGRR